MNVELSAIDKNQKKTLLNLYQFYMYEFTPYFNAVLSNEGLYTIDKRQFDKYWIKDDHWAYFIQVNGELAGFCLLRKYPENDRRYDIEQFFVLTPYKRQGVGFTVFKSLVEAYPGKWQIRVMESNLPALRFWQNCIVRVTQECVTERKVELDDNIYFLMFE